MRVVFFYFWFIIALFIMGCGGGNGNKVFPVEIPDAKSLVVDDNISIGGTVDKIGIPIKEKNTTKNAVLYDSIVANARYDAGSGITGYTDSNGMFRYIEGQNIKFYIGDVFIGEGQPVAKPAGVSVVTDKILTPLELVGAGADISNPKALKIVRFLMSLDRDHNPDNGIDIDGGRISEYNLRLLDDNIELDTAFGTHLALPTLLEAKKHLCKSLHRTNCIQYTQDIAHLFGTATQGTDSSYYYYSPASNAIDNNDSTYNHTRGGKNGKNWIQIELPNPTKIYKIIIQHYGGNLQRLTNAKVYVSNEAFTGTVDEHDLVKTLEVTSKEQIISFNPSKSGRYVLIKGEQNSNDNRHLHLKKVEVYGDIPTMPNYVTKFYKKQFNFGLKLHTPIGTEVGKVSALNYANKLLSYSIVGDVPFSIDNSGAIKLTSLTDHNHVQSYSFKVEMNDGSNSSQANVTVKLLSANGVKLERWIGISGGHVSDLENSTHFQNDNADMVKIVNNLEDYEATVGGNEYGQRLTAILRPTQSGNYIFNLVADKRAELWLSKNDSIMGLEKIVDATWHSSLPKSWNDKYARQSKSIYLEAGNIYRVKVLHKDGGDPNFVAVGWKIDTQSNYKLIPAKNLFIEMLTSENVKPIFVPHITTYTIKSANGIGDKVVSTLANDSQGDTLTYNIVGDVPFSVDNNGQIIINDSLEVKTYSFDVEVSDGSYTVTTHLEITSTTNTVGLNEAKDNFFTKAKAFTKDSNVDELVNSYLAYAHIKAQYTYDEFMPESPDPDIWDYINKNPSIKEGLYASRFPANPYAIKNLARFKAKWKEDGRDDTFIDTYKNVALGLAINAREAGIEKEVSGGDTSEHPTIDYRKLAQYEEKEQRWKEHFDFKNLGYSIGYYAFRNYMKIKYSLSDAEGNSLWGTRSLFSRIENDGESIGDLTPEERQSYGLSFDALNLYRASHGLSRADCYDVGNPCQKIEAYITDENNATLTKSYILAHFKDYKSKIALINASNNSAWSLRGELGVVPKKNNEYRLMSFYDLANWKITNDQIATKDFGDNEPNWPIFHSQLSSLPWQLLALEQSAQKQECEYVKSRFFETDKVKLVASYPPHAVDSRDVAKESRFKQYTTYTWAYNEPEVIYSPSDWSSSRTVYRILQDGGVCGAQSTMGQHVNECLNRPSIGVGQPGHRAWVGVYNKSDEAGQYQTNIGYQVGSRESATAHSELIYNQYTKVIRETGMERFTGVATGVSPASVGEHVYNQSMIMQHIGKLLEEDDSSAEAVLKKSVDLAPQNVDGWYQLALYYASLDKPEKVIALAKAFMDKRESFFLDLDSRKGAENMEVVTAKNIVFIALKAPSIKDGVGERAEWGEQELWAYLDQYEAEYRSLRSYRNQNRYLAKRYLQKEQNEEGFADAVSTLFEHFIEKGSSGSYHSDYFRGVAFKDSNKTELFDRLQSLTDQAQISEGRRSQIYKDILGRSRSLSLATVTVNDVCLDSNLNSCQSLKTFELDAKEVYIMVDNRIGEDKEVDPTRRGEAGYSTLIIPMVDNEGKGIDIKLRIAKIATADGVSGKLLKINDPSEVATDKTTVVVWLDPSDNSIVEGRRYEARQRIILKVKKRVTNNEETMGDVILNVKDLIKGHGGMVFNGTALQSQTYKDASTSIYFTALDSKVGSTKGVWWTGGYTMLTIKVKDDTGAMKSMKLRATNDDSYVMNSGLSASWDNTLKLVYNAEDNPTLSSGTRYKSLTPFTIDARMWHKQDKVLDRMYIEVNMVIP